MVEEFPIQARYQLWFTLGYNIDSRHYPAPSELFAEVEAIMVPTYESEAKPTTDALVAEYDPVLQRDFQLKARSAFWLLYTRHIPHS